MRFNYLNSSELIRHDNCISWQEGYLIFFKCKECGYLRELNFKTMETKILNEGNNDVLHQGFHAPYENKTDINEN